MEFKANGYHETNLSSLDGQAIVKSDTVNLPYWATRLYVGGTGDVTLVTFDGTVLLFTAVAAGTFIPIVFSRVNSTATTATNMVALF